MARGLFVGGQLGDLPLPQLRLALPSTRMQRTMGVGSVRSLGFEVHWALRVALRGPHHHPDAEPKSVRTLCSLRLCGEILFVNSPNPDYRCHGLFLLTNSSSSFSSKAW